MRIDYILEVPVRVVDGWYASDAASARYRVLIPGGVMRRQGHDVKVHAAPTDEAAAAALADRLGAGPGSVTVVSKTMWSKIVPCIERAKARGVRVVVDFCDDHFQTQGTTATQLSLARLADRVSVSTPALAATLRSVAGRDASVITDPFEGAAGTPRFAPAPDTLRLMWFGHQSNLDTVPPLLLQLALWQAGDARAPRRIDFHVVTRLIPQLEAMLRPIEQRMGGRFGLTFTEWTTAATWDALAACDAVVIPSLDNRTKLVKSPNRVVESLRAGRFVVAHPLPAYRDFARHAWIGDDIPAGLAWARANADAAVARIEAGQAWVGEHYAPEALARRWLNLLEDARQIAA